MDHVFRELGDLVGVLALALDALLLQNSPEQRTMQCNGKIKRIQMKSCFIGLLQNLKLANTNMYGFPLTANICINR